MEMIDWVTCKIPFFYAGSLNAGQVISFTQEGELEYLIDKKMSVSGSHDSNVQIRTESVDSEGNTTSIFFSGNPVKFLQGHNLFGTSDLLNLMYELVLDLSCRLSAVQPKNVLEQVKSGYYTISRIDINRMFSLTNRAEVCSFLNIMASNSRTRSQSAKTEISKVQGTILKCPTVYLNKSSKRWSVKMYSKGQEIEAHKSNKSNAFIMPPELSLWADNKLRIELTLQSNELIESGLQWAHKWRNIEELDIFIDYVDGRIEMAKQNKIDNLVLTIKSRPVAATYQLWLDGHDLRLMLPKNTFYRHRRSLLEHDIDISILNIKDAAPVSNVVPLCKVLELKPAEFPHWVSGTEFLFEPRKVC